MRNFIATLIGFLPFSLAHAIDLPDMIRCNQTGSKYQLVIVIKSPKLPDGVTAIALKDEARVVFKTATQMYVDPNGLLSFIEIPASKTSKEVKLDTVTKVAKILNFKMTSLPDGSHFECQY